MAMVNKSMPSFLGYNDGQLGTMRYVHEGSEASQDINIDSEWEGYRAFVLHFLKCFVVVII